jgi:hypothetical protein
MTTTMTAVIIPSELLDQHATLANLLALLIPLGTNIYTQIQQANQDQLKPLADILAAADKNWDAVIAAAQAEIAKASKS